MKKNTMIIYLILIALCLSGCNEAYSFVEANDTIWTKDSIFVKIDDQMKLTRSHPYDIIENENSVDVTFHFKKEK